MPSEDSHETDGSADSATDDSVTVRLTDSVRDGHPIPAWLAANGGFITLPSLPAAHQFAAQLDQHSDGYTYTLTPDHHRETTTFYLRCQEE